jgi:predicted DNA-binding protein YlxM (UPF0122 family)
MPVGYSRSFVEEVERAPASKLGVNLALHCLARDISVREIADYFGVSRVTVYSWFRGKTNIPNKLKDEVSSFIRSLG